MANLKKKKYVKLLPDWSKPSKVVLALPNNYKDNGYREDIVVDLLCYLKNLSPNRAPTVAILFNAQTKQTTQNKLQGMNIELVQVEANDIWIRDWAPLLAIQDDNLLGLKFQYDASYAYNSTEDNQAGRMLHREFVFTQREYGLSWELGNITLNDDGVIIVTDQVLQANGMVRSADLRDYLINTVGCDPKIKVFVLHINDLYKELWDLILGKPEEAICHIDGIMRFTSNKEIVVAKENVANPQARKYRSRFPLNWDPYRIDWYSSIMMSINERVIQLITELQQSVIIANVINIPHSIDGCDEITCYDTLSDYGDFINFLRLGNTMHLPKYSDLGSARRYFPPNANYTCCDVFPPNRFVDRLCVLGGVLNCASWVLYDVQRTPD